jgi:hypothetical protein
MNGATFWPASTNTYEGQPERYAVDAKRSCIYMNCEDKDRAAVVDLKAHKTVAKRQSLCWQDGPHGQSLDQGAGYLFVACSTQAEVLDVGHNGEKLSSIDIGDGVDDQAYSPTTHMLYVGAAKDALLTAARGRYDRQAQPGCSAPDPRVRSQLGRHERRHSVSRALDAG